MWESEEIADPEHFAPHFGIDESGKGDFFGPLVVAGVYVDRLDRKRVMVISDLIRGLLVLGFILVDSADKIWLLYLIGFVQASVGTFFNPARSALIPNLVEKEGLLAANSLTQTTQIIFGR